MSFDREASPAQRLLMHFLTSGLTLWQQVVRVLCLKEPLMKPLLHLQESIQVGSVETGAVKYAK